MHAPGVARLAPDPRTEPETRIGKESEEGEVRKGGLPKGRNGGECIRRSRRTMEIYNENIFYFFFIDVPSVRGPSSFYHLPLFTPDLLPLLPPLASAADLPPLHRICRGPRETAENLDRCSRCFRNSLVLMRVNSSTNTRGAYGGTSFPPIDAPASARLSGTPSKR